MNRIIFGGSFDPFHNAHKRIVIDAYQRFGGIVDLVLSNTAHFKDPSSKVIDRINLIKIGVEDLSYVKVSLYEHEHNLLYTYQLLEFLKKTYPQDKLIFIIGGDQAQNFHLWKKAEFISDNCRLVCYQRPGMNSSKQAKNLLKYHIELITDLNLTTSSTKIRRLQNLDISFLALEYICERQMYYFDIISKYLVGNKYFHSISTALTAYRLATSNRLKNPHRYFRAGLYHDLAKQTASKTIKKYLKDRGRLYDADLNEKVLHQFYASELIRQEGIKLSSEEIRAIEFHTTGNSPMSAIMKIIYLADKLEPLRKKHEDILVFALVDYKKAFISLLELYFELGKDDRKKMDNIYTVAMYKKYLKIDL